MTQRTYGYDNDGNLASSSQGLAASYNEKNQTTSVTPPGDSALGMSYQDATRDRRVTLGDQRIASYMPDLGRWTQRDPAFGQLNSPMSLNPSTYTSCDPINHTDSTGRGDCYEVFYAMGGIAFSVFSVFGILAPFLGPEVFLGVVPITELFAGAFITSALLRYAADWAGLRD